MFSTGKFVASGGFSEANTSRIWKAHADTVKQNYVLRPPRFEALVDSALKTLGSRRARSSALWLGESASGSSSWVLRDPSSPVIGPADDEREISPERESRESPDWPEHY